MAKKKSDLYKSFSVTLPKEIYNELMLRVNESARPRANYIAYVLKKEFEKGADK